jgi:AcrR family transcriptional regulator
MSGPSKRRRLPADERAADLTERAAEAFAVHGFALPTRAIAAECGVTQALLYKYFASKEALVEAVLERRFLSEKPGPDAGVLTGPGPLADRIGAFYVDFVARGAPVNLRLFLRAALDGLDLPVRFAGRLDRRMLRPVLDALRAEIGLAPSAEGPLPPAEREIVMMLHGAVVFTLIRREVYQIEFPIPHADLVRRHARIWTPGALAALRALHEA